MDFKAKMIGYFLKLLVSGQAFKVITEMVGTLMNVDKTNDDKRKEVKDAVMPFVSDFGKFFLSTAIAYTVDKYKVEELIMESSDGK